MVFGFPAYFIERRVFNDRQSELSTILQSALDDLGWRYEPFSGGGFRAKIGISTASWGERLEVRIFPDGTVQVKSKCLYPLQCFDWGKNEENVETFFAQVEKRRRTHRLTAGFAESMPVAGEPGMSFTERIFNEDNEE